MADTFTRPPTGRPSWPIILVDGGPSYGKSHLAYELSASPRVGRTFVFEIGERDADQYVTLGRYEIVVLDGTWSDFVAKLAWVVDQPMVDGLPNVIIIDTISAVWADLKNWASMRARNSARARKILKEDPDADIDVTSNYWVAAKDRWGRMMSILNGFSGISILIARAQEVTAFENGQPVHNETVWSIDAEKNTAFNVTANVSFRAPREPRLIAAKKPGLHIPSDGIPLADSAAMEDLVFRLLASGDPQINQPVGVAPGVPSSQAKQAVIAVYLRAQFSKDDAEAAGKALWHREMGETEPGAEFHRDVVNRLVRVAAEELETPTPPTAAADVSAPEPTEARDDDPPDSEDAQVEVALADMAVANDDHPDPVGDAAAFIAAAGGDPDAPSADPETVEAFDDDRDDEDESVGERFDAAGVSGYGAH